ncbi:MAG TPA: hypothetical protein VFM68_00460 [Candidatus Saccharimonadales bacterium]|nr:hypothetical protein [Candidatus Saccharimonadales bacterium]
MKMSPSNTVPAQPEAPPTTEMAIRKRTPAPVPTQIIPRFGWRAGLYQDAYLANNILEKVGVKTQISAPRLDKLDTLILLYWQLSEMALTKKRIVAVMNSKGGSGKTPFATYLAATLQLAIKKQCGIIDANENNGTTASRLGIDRMQYMMLRAALLNLVSIDDLDKMSTAFGAHKQTGLLLLASDPEKTNKTFTLAQFVELVRTVKKNLHSLVLDTGNGNAHPANEGSFREADIVVNTAIVGNPDSFEGVVTTRSAYYTLGYEDKVRRSFIVISGTRKGDTQEKFYKILQMHVAKLVTEESASVTTARDKMMDDLGITLDNIRLIPYSKYIDGNDSMNAIPPVDLDPQVTGIDTLISVAELAVEIFEEEVPSKNDKNLANEKVDVVKAEKQEQERLQEVAEYRAKLAEDSSLFTPDELEEIERRLQRKVSDKHYADHPIMIPEPETQEM